MSWIIFVWWGFCHFQGCSSTLVGYRCHSSWLQMKYLKKHSHSRIIFVWQRFRHFQGSSQMPLFRVLCILFEWLGCSIWVTTEHQRAQDLVLCGRSALPWAFLASRNLAKWSICRSVTLLKLPQALKTRSLVFHVQAFAAESVNSKLLQLKVEIS